VTYVRTLKGLQIFKPRKGNGPDFGACGKKTNCAQSQDIKEIRSNVRVYHVDSMNGPCTLHILTAVGIARPP
jgi:hypothetical protein